MCFSAETRACESQSGAENLKTYGGAVIRKISLQ